MKAGRRPTSKQLLRRGERLASVVRAQRNKMGMTQDDVAERSGIAFGTLRKIETAETHDPGFFTVADIAHVLGLSLEELAGKPRSRPKAD